MNFPGNATNHKAVRAAAECFVRLTPSYQKNPANHQALCAKIDELSLDPREISSYETAWRAVQSDRAASVEYETREGVFRGREALEKMPSYEYANRLKTDPNFRLVVEELL